MKKTLTFAAILLLLAGSFSCGKEEETIDISNIEDLYSQPLPIIQQCVQGKWNWYASYGGIPGIQYHEDTYVHFADTYYTIGRSDEETQTIPFVWKKLKPEPQFYNLSYDNETYFICYPGEEGEQPVWYFRSIRNDSLFVGSYSGALYDILVRQK
jgi:ABC-type glycerol-3-phosphate transport system substrate-binding protein